MRPLLRLFIAVFCIAALTGAVGLDSGGGSGQSEHYVLRRGALGGSFQGVLSTAGPYQLISAMPVVSIASAVVGDFNADGQVGFGDFLLFAQNFGLRLGQPSFDARFDLTADGQVGFGDFLLFAGAFGQ